MLSSKVKSYPKQGSINVLILPVDESSQGESVINGATLSSFGNNNNKISDKYPTRKKKKNLIKSYDYPHFTGAWP